MSLDLDKTDWKRVAFGEVVDRSREQTDPFSGAVERYVAGGHIVPGSLLVKEGGDVNDGRLGSTFTYAFHPGQVLFVSASWYLRKVGVATFDGVVADKTYVMETKDTGTLDQRFLPWILLSDDFHAYAAAKSTGSMNARLLWKTLAAYEFDLPPLDEQKRIADLLWTVERHRMAIAKITPAAVSVQAPLMSVDTSSFITVEDVVETARSGATPARSNKEFYGGGIPWLKSGEVVGDAISTTSEHITEAGLKGSATWLAPAGAVVVAMYGDGKTRGQVGRLGVDMTTNQAVLALVPSPDRCDRDFLYYWLRSRQEELRGKGAGAAQKNLSKALVISEPFPDLDVDQQRDAVRCVVSIERALVPVGAESASLATLRSSLLNDIFGDN